MNAQELRRLARIGAEARLQDLQREIQTIYRVFPELRSGGSAPNPLSEDVRQAVEGAVTRRRRPRLSRQARKRRRSESVGRNGRRSNRPSCGEDPNRPCAWLRKGNEILAYRALRLTLRTPVIGSAARIVTFLHSVRDNQS